VVGHNLLGKRKAPNYRTLVENTLATFRIMECNMSLNLRFLYSRADFFQATLEMSLMSMVSDFTKISPLQKNVTKTSNAGQLMLATQKRMPVTYLRKASVQ
jgi:hypothetical protein